MKELVEEGGAWTIPEVNTEDRGCLEFCLLQGICTLLSATKRSSLTLGPLPRTLTWRWVLPSPLKERCRWCYYLSLKMAGGGGGGGNPCYPVAQWLEHLPQMWETWHQCHLLQDGTKNTFPST